MYRFSRQSIYHGHQMIEDIGYLVAVRYFGTPPTALHHFIKFYSGGRWWGRFEQSRGDFALDIRFIADTRRRRGDVQPRVGRFERFTPAVEAKDEATMKSKIDCRFFGGVAMRSIFAAANCFIFLKAKEFDAHKNTRRTIGSHFPILRIGMTISWSHMHRLACSKFPHSMPRIFSCLRFGGCRFDKPDIPHYIPRAYRQPPYHFLGRTAFVILVGRDFARAGDNATISQHYVISSRRYAASCALSLRYFW